MGRCSLPSSGPARPPGYTQQRDITGARYGVRDGRTFSGAVMIDWSAPLMARGIRCSDTNAVIDASFAKKPDVQFVRLGKNAWTGDGSGGTWAFNDDGLAVAGMSNEGYQGAFRLVNV